MKIFKEIIKYFWKNQSNQWLNLIWDHIKNPLYNTAYTVDFFRSTTTTRRGNTAYSAWTTLTEALHIYWKSPPSTCQTDLRRLSTLETEARSWKKRERRAQWRRRPAWECSCVSFRDGESQSCRIEVYWGASVPIDFSALIEEKCACNHREVRHGIRPNPLWRRDREGRLDGNCQIQRAKSTSKRFWSYNIYSNDMTDLQKITANLDA